MGKRTAGTTGASLVSATVPGVEFTRGLPSALDQERAVLGSVLLDSHHLATARERLQEPDFAVESHRSIYRAMCLLEDAGKPIEYLTLKEELESAKRLQSVGGTAYLFSLTEGLPRRVSVDEYISTILEKARLRELVVLGSSLAAQAADQANASQEVAAEALGALEQLMADTPSSEMPDIVEQSGSAWEELLAHRSGEKQHYFSYGLERLDALVGGLTKGEMTILGGRPGQGKSSVGNQLISRHCPGGTSVYLASPEMRSAQNCRRLWAAVSGVSFNKIRRPDRMNERELQAVHEAKLKVATWPLYMDESENITVDDICLRAKAAKRKHGAEIVIVDYLQKLRFSSDAKNRFQEVGDAAKKLSNLAKKEDFAVLVLSSLTENGDKRRDDPPKLSDLRQSGDIQYEASTVLLLHRGHKGEDSEDLQDAGEIIVAKARSDETGIVKAWFNPDSLQFFGSERKSWLSGAA